MAKYVRKHTICVSVSGYTTQKTHIVFPNGYKVASLNANLASEARDSNVMVLTIGKGANIINSNINLAISK